MIDPIRKSVRVLALVVVTAVVLSVLPGAIPSSRVAENASAAAEHVVRFGMLQDFENWNPLNIELVSDYIACYLMFSVLFQYNEDWEGPVFDLATGYYQVVHAPRNNMTTYINITQNAYFRNMANPTDTSHRLTAADVEFTIELILANPGGAWDDYLRGVTGVNVTSEFQVAIDTSYAKATLIDNLVWIPILPKYQWQSVPGGQVLTNKDPAWLVGSGPFIFNQSQPGSWYRFDRAPNYHGSTDYPIGDPRGDRVIDVDGVLYVVYANVATAVADMNSGDLDAVEVSGSIDLFLNTLGKGNPFVQKFVTHEMGIIDVAINAIPMDFREANYATGNTLLLDPFVRKAIVMTLNKTAISQVYMAGLPTVADSVLSPGFWHKDIDPEVPFDPAGAKALLMASGYDRDADNDGFLEATSTAYPVMQGWADVGDELSFRLTCPDTDPTYDIVAKAWVGWADDAGILLNYGGPTPEKTMIFNDWYQADYDIWVWAWYWGPEPLSNLAVWKTDQIKKGGDNCQMPMGPWWYSAENSSTGVAYSAYDENFSLAERTFDINERKALVDKLQQWIYDSYCELPPIYPLGLWGVSTEYFTGWGNWTQHLGRGFQSDLPWLLFDLTPTGANMKPVYTNELQEFYQVIVNEPQVFTITVYDPEGDPLTVNWDFGDGQTATDSAASGTLNPTTFTKTHTYTSLAPPPDGLTVSVNVSDGNPGNYAISTGTVYVIPAPDTLPQLTRPIIEDPPGWAYVNQVTTWTVGALDMESGGDNGFGLQFTWSWGDGTYNVSRYQPTINGTEVIDTVTHAWSTSSGAGAYDVELFVWDGSELPGHNVSMGVIPYEVRANGPPSVPIVTDIMANRDVVVNCFAASSDPDGDMLRFTWAWDDGTYSVTEGQADPYELVVSSVDHTWLVAGSYPVTIYVDDLIDEPGHNVSMTVTATIVNPGTGVPPSSLGLVAVPMVTYAGQNITFNASAVDTNGDPLHLTVVFGDGNLSTAVTAGGVTTRQSAEFVHAYELPGEYLVELYADDGVVGHNVTVNLTVTIEENEPPWLVLPTEASAYYGREFVLTPARVRDNDTDPLTVWYEWGDGESSASMGPPIYAGIHVYLSMGTKTVTVWADDGTGLPGHNVSKTVSVAMNENLRPSIVGEMTRSPQKDVYRPGEVISLNITVKDYEGDEVNVTVDWGDGTNTTFGPARPPANTPYVVTLSHSYDEGRLQPYVVTVTVDDGMMPYHSIKQWESATMSIKVEEEKATSYVLWAAAAVIAAIVVALVLFLLLRRKKEGEKPREIGGMEGMKPPEEPPKTP